jgi:hypothetical protein
VEINRRDFVKAGACAALTGASVRATESKYEVGAFYFPNWHVDPRNELVHGKGWTEWEMLKRGEPKFPGHQQPKRPAWGYADESDPRVFEKKIAAAHSAGINHFIFDWYWYEGKPFLERALERGYMRAANKSDVRFCLMWANHDWLNLFPARLQDRPGPLLYKGSYSAAEFDAATDYIVAHYFGEPSYFTVDGAPYFSIYELKNLIDRMGGVEIAQAALARFREKTRSAGFTDLHLNAVAWGLSEMTGLHELLAALNVKSVTSYSWVHHDRFPNFPASEYKDAADRAAAYWTKAKDLFGVPYHLDISVGWDSSPRICQSEMYCQAEYPYTPTLVNNTPELFEMVLRQARSYLEQHRDQPRIISINSWNEWTEGSYLEPDSVHGMGYLNAVRNVFGS